MAERPELVVITGMSGAGRSQAGKALEDLGFFVIDNLPANLIARVVEQADPAGDPRRRRLAVAVDTRGGLSFEALEEVLHSHRHHYEYLADQGSPQATATSSSILPVGQGARGRPTASNSCAS